MNRSNDFRNTNKRRVLLLLLALLFIFFRTTLGFLFNVRAVSAELAECNYFAQIVIKDFGTSPEHSGAFALCAPDGLRSDLGAEPGSTLILDMGPGNEIINDLATTPDLYFYEYLNNGTIYLDKVAISIAKEGQLDNPLEIFVWGDDNVINNGNIPSNIPENSNEPIPKNILHNEWGIKIDIDRFLNENIHAAYRYVIIKTYPHNESVVESDRAQVDAIERVHDIILHPTPTPIITPTLTPSPEPQETATPTVTATQTPTPQNTPTATLTPSPEPQETATPTVTATQTPAPQNTPTPTLTPTPEPQESPTPTVTATQTPAPQNTPTPTLTPTPEPQESPTPTVTATQTPAPQDTPTPTLTPTPEPQESPTPTVTATQTPAPQDTPTPMLTPTPEPQESPTPTVTATQTPAPQDTPTPTLTPTPEPQESPTPTVTATQTPAPQDTPTPTLTPSATPQEIAMATVTTSQIPDIQETTTPTMTATPTLEVHDLPIINPTLTPTSPSQDAPANNGIMKNISQSIDQIIRGIEPEFREALRLSNWIEAFVIGSVFALLWKFIGKISKVRKRKVSSVFGAKVNVNSATKEELMNLKGIGEKYSEKIIAHRPFDSVTDLWDIRGIRKSVLDQNKNNFKV